MEEEDNMSNIYVHQRPEHLVKHRSLPLFQKFNEFDNFELLWCPLHRQRDDKGDDVGDGDDGMHGDDAGDEDSGG